MKLLTREIQDALPPLGQGRSIAYVHFKANRIKWHWYALEGSLVCPNHGEPDCDECPKANWTEFKFFGLVNGLTEEYGYFTLKQLEELNSVCIDVQRDLRWTPKSLNQIKREAVHA